MTDVDAAIPGLVTENQSVPDPDLQRLGAPEDDPDATRWSAGPALPASSAWPVGSADGAPSRGPQLELVRGTADDGSARPRRASGGPAAPTTRPDFRLAADPDVGLSLTPDPTPALPDANERANADRRRRFILPSGPDGTHQFADSMTLEPGPTPPELLTPPDFVTAPSSQAEHRPTPDSALARAADLLPLPGGAMIEPEDPGPPGPFGGPAARDYRYAVADRLPRAVRLLMPAPVAPPEAFRRSYAIESGRRQSDVELQLRADRVRRGALAAEAASTELRRQAALARDQAYEARATWQWTAHRRTALADELQQITAEANTVADEQRRLSEQARRAMRDVSAWDAWIGQLREEASRLATEGQPADAEAALARAEQGQGQVDQLRDWLDLAEQRFRQLGAHLDSLSNQRDARTGASVELAARQQLLVDRYQRLGADAQWMDRDAAEQAIEAAVLRLDARERLIDLAGLRPDLCRWVNESAVALVREGGGRHAVDGGGTGSGAGRRYDVPAGYRRPLLSEHLALEQALPPTPDGAFTPAPEPKPEWLARLNGVGLRSDHSRAQNCVDATLALFDTYVRGRPRVALPRVVDAHRSGTTRLPLRGEPAGRRWLEDALGGNLQLLFTQGAAVQTRFETYQVHAAFDTVADQLRQVGPGAFVVLLAGWQDGDSHTSVAVNYQGTVRWIDPQLGTVADAAIPAEWVRSLEVLMVDGAGRPMPFPGMPLSPWTTRTASAAYATAVTEPAPSGFPPPPAVTSPTPALTPWPAPVPEQRPEPTGTAS